MVKLYSTLYRIWEKIMNDNLHHEEEGGNEYDIQYIFRHQINNPVLAEEDREEFEQLTRLYREKTNNGAKFEIVGLGKLFELINHFGLYKLYSELMLELGFDKKIKDSKNAILNSGIRSMNKKKFEVGIGDIYGLLRAPYTKNETYLATIEFIIENCVGGGEMDKLMQVATRQYYA